MRNFINLKLLFIATILLSITSIHAQSIKLKKEEILIDNEHILNYKISDFRSKIQVFTIKTNEEIVFINYQSVEGKYSNYWKIYFPGQDRILYKKIISSLKGEIELLFQDKVINSNGIIDNERLDLYVKKYNEL